MSRACRTPSRHQPHEQQEEGEIRGSQGQAPPSPHSHQQYAGIRASSYLMSAPAARAVPEGSYDDALEGFYPFLISPTPLDHRDASHAMHRRHSIGKDLLSPKEDAMELSWLTSNTPRRAASGNAPENHGVSPLPRPPFNVAAAAPTPSSDASSHSSTASSAFTNPWAPVRKRHPGRQWGVEALQRDDVLLFYIDTAEMQEKGLQDALAAATAHVQYLLEQRRLCPTAMVARRCALNDLYVNAYPKLFLMLRHMWDCVQATSPSFSPSVRRLLLQHQTVIHSGNILQVFDAVAHCEAN